MSENTSAAAIHDEALKKAEEKLKSLEVSEERITQKDEEGEDLSNILVEEAAAEANYASKLKEFGIDNLATIDAAIRVLESWILLYKLKSMDDLIEEIFPIVVKFTKEHENHQLYIKVVQLKAFMRYKQFRHREALTLFYEFKDLTGASPELLENMGHTHNVVGEHEKALTCFKDALEIYKIREKIFSDFERNKVIGGVLLGLGTTYRAMKMYDDALDYMNQALESFQSRMNGKDHSLVAKTLSGIGSTYMSMENYPKALETYKESLRIFKITCGVSPLTANSYYDVASAAQKLQLYVECSKHLEDALDMHVDFDTLDMPKIILILNAVLDAKPKLIGVKYPTENDPALTLNTAFKIYKPMLDRCVENMKKQKIDDGDNAAVFYKACGEVLVLGAYYLDAIAMLKRASDYFGTVTTLNCSNLIEQCKNLSSIALSLYAGNKSF